MLRTKLYSKVHWSVTNTKIYLALNISLIYLFSTRIAQLQGLLDTQDLLTALRATTISTSMIEILLFASLSDAGREGPWKFLSFGTCRPLETANFTSINDFWPSASTSFNTENGRGIAKCWILTGLNWNFALTFFFFQDKQKLRWCQSYRGYCPYRSNKEIKLAHYLA